MVKDTLEKATEPNLDLKAYLKDAYVHPVFKSSSIEQTLLIDDEENNTLVPTKRTSHRGSKLPSEDNSETDAYAGC